MPAHAEVHFLRSLGLIFNRYRVCALVAAITKRLVLAAAAGAPPIRLSSLHVDALGGALDANDFVTVFNVGMSGHVSNKVWGGLQLQNWGLAAAPSTQAAAAAAAATAAARSRKKGGEGWVVPLGVDKF